MLLDGRVGTAYVQSSLTADDSAASVSFSAASGGQLQQRTSETEEWFRVEVPLVVESVWRYGVFVQMASGGSSVTETMIQDD